MMQFIIGLLAPLGGFIAAILKALGPPIAVVEAEKAGAATQALSDVEAQVKASDQASAAAGQAVRSADASAVAAAIKAGEILAAKPGDDQAASADRLILDSLK